MGLASSETLYVATLLDGYTCDLGHAAFTAVVQVRCVGGGRVCVRACVRAWVWRERDTNVSKRSAPLRH